MPRGDRTGRMGQGPMTGRSLGYCVGNNAPGYVQAPGAGMGSGFGMGQGSGMGQGFAQRRAAGRGRRMGFGRFSGFGAPVMNQEDELSLLQIQAESLKRSQQDIEKRMEQLRSKKNE